MSRILGLGVGLALFLVNVGARAEVNVIYGEDDRRDLFDSRNDEKLVELAKSTAIIVKKSDLKPIGSDSEFSLPTETFGSSMGLCKDEPFFDQPSPGFCSGFLVGEDVFVTAGHCIRDQESCSATSFVFDFGYDFQGKDLSKVSADQVFHCKKIISRALEGTRGKDFAIVRLDRAVTGRAPLKLRSSGALKSGDGVTVIGHPSGLPTKITSSAKVRTNETDKPYFVANLDTYGGNSGSAVFNTATGEVEGILVRGETDFVSRGACQVSNHCAETGCRGEDVTKTSAFVNAVPAE